jgi:hypothetical protein
VVRDVTVDFRVKAPRKTSLVKTVTASNPDSAHVQLTEIFARWHGLAQHHKENQFVTVLEDKDIYRPADVALLSEVSDGVLNFPSERERLRSVLMVA